MTIISDTSIPIRLVVFECNHCQKRFERGQKTKPRIDYKVLSKSTHFCSLTCAYEAREQWKLQPVDCTGCLKPMLRIPCKIHDNNFCSKKCYGKWLGTTEILQSRKPVSDDTRLRISKAKQGTQTRLGAVLSDETKTKISRGNKGKLIGDKNPMWGKTHTPEVKEAMSEIVSREMISGKRKGYGKNNHVTGRYLSTKTNEEMHYRSSWELAAMQWLDSNVIVKTYRYESIRIPYLTQESERQVQRHYVPDFMIEFTTGEKELWELKPEKLSQNEKTKAKVIAATEFCNQNKMKFRLLHKQDLLKLSVLLT